MSPAGVLRALPVHSETEIFIYNKEMFEAAGVDPENIPQTWDELYELSPKLTEGNRYPERRALDRAHRPQVDPVLARLLQLVPGREVRVRRLHAGPVRQRRGAARRGEAIDRGFKAELLRPGRRVAAERLRVGPGVQPGPVRLPDQLLGAVGPGGQRQRRGLQGDDQPGRRRRERDAGRPARHARRLQRLRGLRDQQVQRRRRKRRSASSRRSPASTSRRR